MKEIPPEEWFWKTFPSLWRSKGICGQIKKEKIDIYHGLSQELPIGIEKINVKSVVTVHDAIFFDTPNFILLPIAIFSQRKTNMLAKLPIKSLR